MRLMLALACSLWVLPVAAAQKPPPGPQAGPQPSNPWVVARGDFDGDGTVDTVEKVPGTLVGGMRLQVRLATNFETPYLLVEGGDVEKMPIEVGRAGPYVVQMAYGRPPAFQFRRETMSMANDVVLFTVPNREPHRMMKHWSADHDSFVGLNLMD